jgi:hypothetical protein
MEPVPIKCIACSAPARASRTGFTLDYPDNWMMFVGHTSTARNREVWLCQECGKKVPENSGVMHMIQL